MSELKKDDVPFRRNICTELLKLRDHHLKCSGIYEEAYNLLLIEMKKE